MSTKLIHTKLIHRQLLDAGIQSQVRFHLAKKLLTETIHLLQLIYGCKSAEQVTVLYDPLGIPAANARNFLPVGGVRSFIEMVCPGESFSCF